MQLCQNELGSKLYIWTKTAGAASPGVKECVISAHGGQTIINSRFEVKGVTLRFYCPHGYALTDPGLEAVITQSVRHCQEVKDGKVQDYVLSKYQGKHNKAGETYQKIGGLAETLEKGSSDLMDATLDFLGKYAEETNEKRKAKFLEIVDRNIAQLESKGRWMDIITLRNRRMRFDLNLSEVIKKLNASGYGYTTVHCSFCRCPMFGGPGSYQAKPA